MQTGRELSEHRVGGPSSLQQAKLSSKLRGNVVTSCTFLPKLDGRYSSVKIALSLHKVAFDMYCCALFVFLDSTFELSILIFDIPISEQHVAHVARPHPTMLTLNQLTS